MARCTETHVTELRARIRQDVIPQEEKKKKKGQKKKRFSSQRGVQSYETMLLYIVPKAWIDASHQGVRHFNQACLTFFFFRLSQCKPRPLHSCVFVISLL